MKKFLIVNGLIVASVIIAAFFHYISYYFNSGYLDVFGLNFARTTLIHNDQYFLNAFHVVIEIISFLLSHVVAFMVVLSLFILTLIFFLRDDLKLGTGFKFWGVSIFISCVLAYAIIAASTLAAAHTLSLFDFVYSLGQKKAVKTIEKYHICYTDKGVSTLGCHTVYDGNRALDTGIVIQKSEKQITLFNGKSSIIYQLSPSLKIVSGVSESAINAAKTKPDKPHPK